MGNLSSLTFMLGANIKEFQTKMRKVSADLKKTGKNMKSMGKSMSMYVTAPIAAMGAASLAAFDKQAQAEAKLAAQVRANGKDVEATMASYKTFASELQAVTTVGDEATLGLMQMAESMGAADVKGATQGAIALSKALGVDLQAALKMTALAQQGEYTMLNRYVPALRSASSETEKAAIVAKLYADGLKIAKAEAQTGLGPLKQLQNTLGDVSEEFGAIIAEGIKPIVDWLKKAVASFQGLSDKGKKTIVIIAGIAAAIGPLLIIFGTMLTILPMIGAAFTAMLGPVGLVIAAIAAIAAAFVYVYANWEAFKERLGDWDFIKNAAIDAFSLLIKVSSFFLNEIAKLFGVDFVAYITDALDSLKSPTKEYEHTFKSFGGSLKTVAKDVATALGFMAEKGKEGFDNLANSAIGAGNRIKENIAPIITMPARTIDIPIVVNYSVLTVNKPNPPEFVEEYNEELMKLQETATLVGNSVGNVFEDMGNRMADAFNKGRTGFGRFVHGIIRTVVKLIAMMLASSISNAIYGATEAGKSTGPAAVWTTPAFIAAAVGGVVAAFASIPKFATGGTVPSGYPNDSYLARLTSGERIIPAGIPLPNMNGGGYGGEITVNVVGKISGKDILIISDKATIDRSRIRGY